jgi:hypothetical protein
LKGVVMQMEEGKSIVMFNNGKIGTIPAPAGCQVGTVITVSYRKKSIVLCALLISVVLASAFLFGRFLYVTPVGYIQIIFTAKAGANAAVELAYNRFERILAARPLNTQAVTAAADLAVRNKTIPAVYQDVMKAFMPSPKAQGAVKVRIAQNDLPHARAIQDRLSLLAETGHVTIPEKVTVSFDLYTIELYHEAMTASGQYEYIPVTPENHHWNGWERRQGKEKNE